MPRKDIILWNGFKNVFSNEISFLVGNSKKVQKKKIKDQVLLVEGEKPAEKHGESGNNTVSHIFETDDVRSRGLRGTVTDVEHLFASTSLENSKNTYYMYSVPYG